MVLVVMSLGFCLFVMTFHDAVGATPWETEDSAGRTMGFNDRFSPEHFGILLRSCSLVRTLTPPSVYEGALIAAHGLMLVLLLWCPADKWVYGFAVLQPFLFPWGIAFPVTLPHFLLELITRDVGDREAFIDIPYVAFKAHPMWVLVSLIIAWCAFRSGRRRVRDGE